MLASGATLYGVQLQNLEFGQGIVILPDGSAIGDFQTLLLGTSPLGQPQNLNVEGKVSSGSVQVNGSVTFGGTASVDLGNGTPPLTGVPFSVTAIMEGLQLVIGTRVSA